MDAVVESAENQTTAVSSEENLGGKYLTFLLDGEEYGLEILKVREIIGIMDITRVPRMSDFVKGVINLRGKVILVVDLRLKFSLQPTEYNEETCIIVVDIGMLVGMIVDTVQEVHDIPTANIEQPPQMGAAVDSSFILGMGKVGEQVKILLNIEKVLSPDEILSLQETTDSQPT